ncbi:MAG: hypothetical protein QOD63_1663 [Actinomycetota bacterium]|jgi:uncharacterized YccA/Bax inhibitor family protein|nr:hypothetical protein [Actinomycetota bacterium]
MRSGNPALNEKIFDRETRAAQAGAVGTETRPPVDDTVSPWTPTRPPVGYQAMTVGGTISATAVLLVILMVGGWVGWMQVKTVQGEVSDFPGWLLLPLFAALGVAILTIFKPKLARFTSPVYAVLEGVVLGAISHVYEAQWDNIVVQAVGLTVGVLAMMLFLYATRVIKVTEKLRIGIIAATGAVFLVYLVSMVLSLFGVGVPFIHESGPVGIIFSLVVVGIAAMNLVLDFDFIERGAAAGAPKYMEWYGAFGLMVTLVWLYLELLRLLGKVRS